MERGCAPTTTQQQQHHHHNYTTTQPNLTQQPQLHHYWLQPPSCQPATSTTVLPTSNSNHRPVNQPTLPTCQPTKLPADWRLPANNYKK